MSLFRFGQKIEVSRVSLQLVPATLILCEKCADMAAPIRAAVVATGHVMKYPIPHRPDANS